MHRGRVRQLDAVPADRTLLTLLREDLGLTSVKEGCASDDCGACTVAVADHGPDGALRWRALNSCIRLAHAANGCAVWTAEDLTQDPLIAPAPCTPCSRHWWTPTARSAVFARPAS